MQTFCQWLSIVLLLIGWLREMHVSKELADPDELRGFLVLDTVALVIMVVVLYGAGAFSRIL